MACCRKGLVMRWGDSVGVRWVRMDSVCGGGGGKMWKENLLNLLSLQRDDLSQH